MTLKEDLRLSVALETLHELESYFDKRANYDNGIANEEMRMLVLIRGAICMLKEGKADE
jgi:hypothetical protein